MGRRAQSAQASVFIPRSSEHHPLLNRRGPQRQKPQRTTEIAIILEKNGAQRSQPPWQRCARCAAANRPLSALR